MKKDQATSSAAAGHPLWAGDEHYRRLFDEAIEGICLADRETGIIQDCNHAFLQLTGYEREELLGKPQAMLHPPEEGRPPVSRTFAMHRSEKQGEVLNTLLVTKSGTVKEVEIKASPIELGGRQILHGFFRDMTEELRGQRERETTLTLLRLLNDRNHTRELIRNLTGFLQKWSGCEAVGIRLREGDDFPYFETRGFAAEFVEAENYLCQHDLNGQILRDGWGNPLLACMCGNILRGRFDPALPFYTAHGSFWTNCTTELLANTTEAERQGRTRNRCNSTGYESVALIPLRHGDQVLGLLQLNDRARGRFTPELISFLEYAADQIAIALAQRQAQAALAASEERYRRLFEVESDAVFLVDCETHRFIEANGAALKMYRYSREEFLLLKARDISAEPEKTERAISMGMTHIPLRWHRKKDGTVFPVEIVGGYFDYQGRKVHVATIRDITERRRSESLFLQANERLELAKRAAGAGIWDWDMKTGCLEWSPEMFALFGLDPEKAKASFAAWHSVLHPEDISAASDRIEQDIREHRPHVSEYRILRPDGHLRWISALGYTTYGEGGKPIRMTGVCMDVTDRKLAEKSLRESEERYRGLFEHMTEGYAYCRMLFEDGRARDWIYLAVNEAFETLTGLKNVAGKRVSEVIPGIRESDPELFAIYARVASTGKPEKFEMFVESLKMWFCISVYSPEKECFVAVFDVIDDRKQAEENLQHAQKQLEHIARLSTMGELVAGIAHEVNQPLYSIVNYAKACGNVLMRDEPPLEDLREWSREIAVAAARAGEVIKRIRDFVRRSKPQLLPTDINELIADSLALVAFELRRRRVSVRRLFSETAPVAKIDPVQVQQVLVNLLLNACEALAEKAPGARQLTIQTARAEGFIEVSVADNGPGLPPRESLDIFEPFVTTKPHGLGMGLAISKRIVKAHGGKLWAESNLEGGATFHFTLPVAKGEPTDGQ